MVHSRGRGSTSGTGAGGGGGGGAVTADCSCPPPQERRETVRTRRHSLEVGIGLSLIGYAKRLEPDEAHPTTDANCGPKHNVAGLRIENNLLRSDLEYLVEERIAAR